jgi:hypothetical protein
MRPRQWLAGLVSGAVLSNYSPWTTWNLKARGTPHRPRWLISLGLLANPCFSGGSRALPEWFLASIYAALPGPRGHARRAGETRGAGEICVWFGSAVPRASLASSTRSGPSSLGLRYCLDIPRASVGPWLARSVARPYCRMGLFRLLRLIIKQKHVPSFYRLLLLAWASSFSGSPFNHLLQAGLVLGV